MPERREIRLQVPGKAAGAVSRKEEQRRRSSVRLGRSVAWAGNEALVPAGVIALMARLRMGQPVTVVHKSRTIHMTVDLKMSFQYLAAEVERERAGGKAAAGPADNQVPDAYVAPGETSGDPAGDGAGDGAGDATGESARSLDGIPCFAFCQTPDGLHISLTSDETEAQQTKTLRYLATLLEHAGEQPQVAVGKLRLLPEADALALYDALNHTETLLPESVTVLQLFAEAVAANRDRAAVVFGGHSLSYAELGAASTVLSESLRAMGASQSRPVAVCIPRSEKMPLVLLAAMKAGSYYVPLDPTHPPQRLADMLVECRPAVVVVAKETHPLVSATGLTLLDVDEALPTAGATGEFAGPVAADRVYMIYTSGTTGRPKGVIIQHGALANLLLAMRERPGMHTGDRMLAVATLAFDISAMDLLLPLICGATCIVAPESAAQDPAALARLLKDEAVTCMQATPATWRMLVSSGYKGDGRLKILTGGEALPRDLADELLQIGAEVWNCYGPTETTVYSSVMRVAMQVDNGIDTVAIGPPIANTCFYVVDEAGQLLPPEVAGELWIGGAGVAAGYFERPELDCERFVLNPWLADARRPGLDMQPKLFCTGDLVRLRHAATGEFEFLGRIDHQVKLRGFRIELGEIECVMRSHPMIQDAAVILREDEPGEPWLVAYITQEAGVSSSVRALRESAAQRLPAYMLPARVVKLLQMPLTSSGKVDRRALGALPRPADDRADDPGRSATGSMDALETALLRIFREVLRSRAFGPEDDFFEFGGYSLLAVRLFARIDATLHRKLPITALFDAPTVRRLAALIRSGHALEALVSIREGGKEAPFFVVHSYLLYGLVREVVDDRRPVYGLRERSAADAPLDLQHCVDEYAATIQRAYPAGPVHLGGWCAAATLTLELSRRLLAEGREMGMVALFDAEAPGFVARPQSGSPLAATLEAMWRFHAQRLRSLQWTEQLPYLRERAEQAPLRWMERWYAGRHAQIDGWRLRLPWLPGVLFNNRFTQIGLLQAEHIDEVDVRIHLFRARDVVTIRGSDEALGWSAVGRRGVEVVYIPGHHESMFQEPNLAVLREQLQACMVRTEQARADARTVDGA